MNLQSLSLSDMVRCGAEMRKFGIGARSCEEVASGIARYLYDTVIDPNMGERSNILVRCYISLPFSELPDDLKVFASRTFPAHQLLPQVKCLTLLGTCGDEPAWNSRHTSTGHKAIPLPSAEVIHQLPMISQLVLQFGLQIHEFLEPDNELILDLEQRTYNVFHVPDALGSAFIPAQADFVVPHGVKSVLGFGGILPRGDLFAIILFSRHAIPHTTADMFRTIALSAKMAFLPTLELRQIFEPGAEAASM